ncbi:MAG: hypothetical protein R3E84_02955 [Pseudomonadales bacterium]
MIPAVSQWTRRLRLPASGFMIPLSYASILGGTLTLIEADNTVVWPVPVYCRSAGFILFDISLLGLANYDGRHCVPGSVRAAPAASAANTLQAFADKRSFTVEVAVAADGPLPGKTIEEAGLRQLQSIYLAEIERQGSIITAVGPEQVLHVAAIVSSSSAKPRPSSMCCLHQRVGAGRGRRTGAGARCTGTHADGEAVIAPNCEVIGQTIQTGRFT